MLVNLTKYFFQCVIDISGAGIMQKSKFWVADMSTFMGIKHDHHKTSLTQADTSM